jgi:hypothetical protein
LIITKERTLDQGVIFRIGCGSWCSSSSSGKRWIGPWARLLEHQLAPKNDSSPLNLVTMTTSLVQYKVLAFRMKKKTQFFENISIALCSLSMHHP